MATHKSAEKRARQSIRKTAVNTATLSKVRTFERKVRSAVASKDKAAANGALKEFSSVVMKAATKGVVHKSTASRKIGRLALSIGKMA